MVPPCSPRTGNAAWAREAEALYPAWHIINDQVR